MTRVTFQVIEGVDKGRVFRDMATPVTIGREEGNILRLNDERVSRYHAKVQQDNGDVILTDLDSTNGTRVNNQVVQIRRLRPGDVVSVGRSILRFGTNEEIMARLASLRGQARTGAGTLVQPEELSDAHSRTLAAGFDDDLNFDLNPNDEITPAGDAWFMGQRELPPLPQKMTPAQAARLAEILNFLHRGLTHATENIQSNDDGTQIVLNFRDWQTVLAVQMLLAKYQHAVCDPDALLE